VRSLQVEDASTFGLERKGRRKKDVADLVFFTPPRISDGDDIAGDDDSRDKIGP
jgi:stress response protein SCP2